MRAGRALIGAEPQRSALQLRSALELPPASPPLPGASAAGGTRPPALVPPGAAFAGPVDTAAPPSARPGPGGCVGRGRAPGHRRTLGATPSPPPVRGRCVATSTAPAPFFPPAWAAHTPRRRRRGQGRRAGARPGGRAGAGPADGRLSRSEGCGLRVPWTAVVTLRGLAGCGCLSSGTGRSEGWRAAGPVDGPRHAGPAEAIVPRSSRLAASRGFLGIILFSRSTFGTIPVRIDAEKTK